MKVIAILSIVCIVLLTFPIISRAQSKEWTVVTSTHDTLRSCIIGTLKGDTVNLISGNSVVQISVDSLSMLIRHGETQFWSGAGYGTLAGVAVGAFVGLAADEKSTGTFALNFGPGVAALGGGILGAVTGFTIGGIIGAVSGGDEKHDLSQEPTGGKIKILRDLRRENR
jgi:hypothetical protein